MLSEEDSVRFFSAVSEVLKNCILRNNGEEEAISKGNYFVRHFNKKSAFCSGCKNARESKTFTSLSKVLAGCSVSSFRAF